MRIPLAHRLLGFAGIYAYVRALHIAAIGQEARLTHQENLMSTLQEDVTSLATAEQALEQHITEQDATIQSLKDQIQPGTVISDELAASIHSLAEKSGAFLAAGFKAPSDATSETPSTDGDSASTDTEPAAAPNDTTPAE